MHFLQRWDNLFLALISGFHFRLAEEKKEEGNQLYKLKQYRDALSKYSEAIGKFYNLTPVTHP